MPVVFRYQGFRFFFYSNEGDPLEPCHIHVQKESNVAKFWVGNEIILAESYGMSSKELTMLRKIIQEHQQLIEDKWHEFFFA